MMRDEGMDAEGRYEMMSVDVGCRVLMMDGEG